jgi:hypothetical protein
MTKERREEIRTMLLAPTFVRIPCVEDGPEVLRDKMQILHRVLDTCATCAVELRLAQGFARSRLLYVETLRRAGERNPQALQDAKEEFHEIGVVLSVANIRFAEVRGLLKDLRALARLMENMYAHATTGIWSLKSEAEMAESLDREERKRRNRDEPEAPPPVVRL